MFLKIPESSCTTSTTSTEANLNHGSTNSTNLFFSTLHNEGMAGFLWLMEPNEPKQSLRTAFIVNKLFLDRKRLLKNKQHSTTTPFKVNIILRFSLFNIIYIWFCKFMFLQNYSKVALSIFFNRI